MQLPMTAPVVLAALLAAGPITDTATAAAAPVATANDSDCPAYLGPQCDSAFHEVYATGQDIAGLALQIGSVSG